MAKLPGSAWLLAVAALCVAASYALDRFGFEVCHRGLPLAALSIGFPLAGGACALWPVFHRKHAAIVAAAIVVLAANSWQLVTALLVLGGAGFVSCG